MTRRFLLFTIIATLVWLSARTAGAQAEWSVVERMAPPWPDTVEARLAALALIQTLNADILGSRSATASLEKWCADHGLAEVPAIQARVILGPDEPATPEQRQRLQATAQTVIKYRKVQLHCGIRLLSEAGNWYVPERLSTEMNRLLDTSTTPFGTLVRDLEPYRRTFDVRQLWSPLPPDWARGSSPVRAVTRTSELAMPAALFEHRAVLFTRDHVPFSEVHEVYQRGILAFPLPRIQ